MRLVFKNNRICNLRAGSETLRAMVQLIVSDIIAFLQERESFDANVCFGGIKAHVRSQFRLQLERYSLFFHIDGTLKVCTFENNFFKILQRQVSVYARLHACVRQETIMERSCTKKLRKEKKKSVVQVSGVHATPRYTRHFATLPLKNYGDSIICFFKRKFSFLKKHLI